MRAEPEPCSGSWSGELHHRLEAWCRAIYVVQVQGAFMQGVGGILREGMEYAADGQPLSINHVLYKPPVATDVPSNFRAAWWTQHGTGAFGAKTVSEPPVNLSCAVYGALHDALQAARKEFGLESWEQLALPVSAEQLALKCGAQDAITSPTIWDGGYCK